MTTHGLETKQPLFDRQFVLAATVIGAAYAGVVVAIGSLAGKEAAGVAGVALTALATAVFKQFETLRFRRSANAAAVTISVPRLDYAVLTLIILAFVGTQFLLGLIAGLIAKKMGIMTSEMTFSGAEVAVLLAGTALAFLLTGAVAGSASERAPGLTYTYVILGSLLAIVINVGVAEFFLGGQLGNPMNVLSLLYVGLAMVGAYIGIQFRGRSKN